MTSKAIPLLKDFDPQDNLWTRCKHEPVIGGVCQGCGKIIKEDPEPTAENYIQSLEPVLAQHFAPGQIYHGEKGALRLAREVGHGLADFPPKQVENILGSLYSRLLVRHTLSGTGVPLDNKEFVREILKAVVDQKKRPAQLGLFPQGQDLPLFTGTPDVAQVEGASLQVKSRAKQLALF